MKPTINLSGRFYFIVDEAQEIGSGMRLEAMLSEGANRDSHDSAHIHSLSHADGSIHADGDPYLHPDENVHLRADQYPCSDRDKRLN